MHSFSELGTLHMESIGTGSDADFETHVLTLASASSTHLSSIRILRTFILYKPHSDSLDTPTASRNWPPLHRIRPTQRYALARAVTAQV